MLSKTKIAISAAIVLGSAFTASAASNHRITHANPVTYSICPPSGGPSCSTACLPSGPPCKTEPDGW